MSWLMYICIFFSDLVLLTVTLRGGGADLITIAYCLFFSLLAARHLLKACVITAKAAHR